MLFSYIKRSKAGDGVQSRLTKLSCTNERLTDSPLKRQFFKTTQVSHLFASSWILWWVFCGNNFGKLSALGIWHALRKRDDYVLRGKRPRRITPSSISIILHKILSLIHYLLILCTSSIQFPQYRNMARLWSFPLNTRCPLNIQSGQLGFQWILLMTRYIFDFSSRLMPLLTFLE